MSFLDLLFPKSCVDCGREGKYICDICLQKVAPGGWYGDNYSVFKYDGVIRKAIIALKYKFATQIANELAEIIVQRVSKLGLKFEGVVLVPIALHRQRENWRGFNQSREIGRKFANMMGWEFNDKLLIKHKKTAPQAELKGTARRQNLHGVFSVSSKPININNKTIIIFDDVATTGSTISEAKRALNEAGLTNIWGLTIAR